MEISEFVSKAQNLFELWEQGSITDEELWALLPFEEVFKARYERKRAQKFKEGYDKLFPFQRETVKCTVNNEDYTIVTGYN